MSRLFSLLQRSVLGHPVAKKPTTFRAVPQVEALEARWMPSVGMESEGNDSLGAANIIAVPVGDVLNLSGQISTGGDEDWFKFTLDMRSGVFFDIDSRETLSTTLDSFLTLYNSGGMSIVSNDDGYDFDTGFYDAAGSDSALYRDLAAGDYFIRVTSFNSGSTGNYILRAEADTNYSLTAPALNSLPGAAATIFLDFDGHSAAPDAWGTYNAPGFDFNGNAAEFTPGEQRAIRNIWRTVSEDYSPFNINISTSYSGPFTDGVAMRAVYTTADAPIVGQPTNILGVAFLNSFAGGGPSDNVCWVFAGNFDQSFGGGSSGQIMATAVEQGNTTSHEVGHTLGLLHFSTSMGSAGPLASVIPNAILATPDTGYNREIWAVGTNDNGDPQDDMLVISNVIGYRADDHADITTSATVLVASGNTYSGSGIISHPTTDRDVFRFVGGGSTTISVDVNDYINNLDVQVRLLDAGGAPIATSDPSGSFDAFLSQTLTAGTYYIEILSNGGDGEAGQYTFTITTTVAPPPVANNQTLTTAEETDLLGTLTATIPVGPAVTYSIMAPPTNGTLVSFNSATGAFTYRPNVNYFSSTPDTFTFVANNGSNSNTATISITVTPVADTPSVTNAITIEDVQTTSGLVISRNPADMTEVTHFKITSITSGTLFLNNGITPIANNSFITFADANAGLRFTPAAGFFGAGSFQVQSSTSNSDPGLGGGPATATITVNPQNDAPTATDDAVQVSAGNGATFINVLGNDSTAPDVGETLVVQGVFPTSAGATVAVASGGSGVLYTPRPGFTGIDTFTYSISDGSFTAVATVTVTVSASAPAPAPGAPAPGTPAPAAPSPAAPTPAPAPPAPASDALATGQANGALTPARLFDAVTGALLLQVDAFPGSAGSMNATSGDVNGDGTTDLIVAAGPGGNTHVKVFNGTNGALLLSFFAYTNFQGGVFVAAGDVDGDGRDDILTGANAPNGHVKVFSGATGTEIRSFFAFQGFQGGVTVAAGDVNGDGYADVVAGAGTDSGPGGGHVKVFSGASSAELLSFFAFPGFSGGIRVSAGDIDGDGRAEILTGTLLGAAHVKVFSPDARLLTSLELASVFVNGVDVVALDVNGDGRKDLVTAEHVPSANSQVRPSPVPDSLRVRAFRDPDLAEINDPFALDGILGAVDVG